MPSSPIVKTMLRITSDEFKTVPWKNGKGITQQIISSSDDDDYDWRFSRAQVTTDGPFSIFNGKSRILTVIEGAGLSLISSSSVIEAKPFEPVRFSGAVEITGKLWQGPIMDLNLIYSSERIKADAQCLQTNELIQLTPENSVFYALYCSSGQIEVDSGKTLNSGDFGLIIDAPCTISIDNHSQVLLYTLQTINE